MSETKNYPLLSQAQLLALCDDASTEAFVMFVGLPASGKSVLASYFFEQGFVYLNGDSIRAELYGDESVQGSPSEVYGRVRKRLHRALCRREKIVLDLTNHTFSGRREWLDQVRGYGYKNIHIVIMDTPLEVCLERNLARSRVLPEDVLRGFYKAMLQSGAPFDDEGQIHVLKPGPMLGSYYLVPVEDYRKVHPCKCRKAGSATQKEQVLEVTRASDSQLDIIGDVHGCYDELLLLLQALGYKFELDLAADGSFNHFDFQAPTGRKLAFVGDYVDRGPHSDKVLALLMRLVELDLAVAVKGNHDERLLGYLSGNPVKVGRALGQTIAQLDSCGSDFTGKVRCFLEGLSLVYETENLLIVHGAYRENVPLSYARSLCLYGETDGSLDENGYIRRFTHWEKDYQGDKFIIRGHDVVRKPRFRLTAKGKATGNIDTGCAFGLRLTALRYPEMKLVSVPALATYCKLFGSDEVTG